MTSARDLADAYVDRLIVLDPVFGTSLGVRSADAELPDWSPTGVEAARRLAEETLAGLREARPADEADRRTRDVLTEVLEDALRQHELGEPYRTLRNFSTPLERVRAAFDLMPHREADDWPTVVQRMEAVPETVAGIAATLREGMTRGIVAARRQALVVAEQAEAWGGARGTGYFARLVGADTVPSAQRGAAERAAADAEASIRGFAVFLRDEYAPVASEEDAVGRDRYAAWARHYNGLDLDLEETYAWGWSELRRLDAEIAATSAQIVPEGGFRAARELLSTDPARVIHGVDAFREWLQELTDQAVRELNGTHFDISPQAQTIECMIAPPGGAAAMYYTPPTEDWSRPGRTWYPAGDRTEFPTWEEVTTAYHEGVPGHHLQNVASRLSSGGLTRFQKCYFSSGHGEGWALYAERLMDELGYHESPDTRLGMLVASAFRAARVILDIGLHLQLRIPADADFEPGEPWTYQRAQAFLARYAARGEPFVTSEVDRYLGMPGQAISYKVGEREWLDIREQVRRAEGDAFDLRAFHSRALDLGAMGLAQLRRELVQPAA